MYRPTARQEVDKLAMQFAVHSYFKRTHSTESHLSKGFIEVDGNQVFGVPVVRLLLLCSIVINCFRMNLSRIRDQIMITS
jgi:hypothetical protein